MRTGLLMLLIVAAMAGGVVGQPKDGDLIFAVSQTYPTTLSYLAYLDPTRPSAVSTLANAPANTSARGVRMAPSNSDLVVAETDWGAVPVRSQLTTVTANGARQPFPFSSALPGDPAGFELDHDGAWIVAANASWGPHLFHTLTAVHATGGARVFTVVPGFLNMGGSAFGDVAIDRDPGSAPYCVYRFWWQKQIAGKDLLRADRQGALSTIFGFSQLWGHGFLELHPRSGDYLTSHTLRNSMPPDFDFLARMTKSGRMTTLSPNLGFFAAAGRIMQDDTVWLGSGNGYHELLQYDLAQNAMVTLVKLPGSTLVSPVTGIEVYGSRRLVCHQQPTSPKTVTVNVQSRDVAAAGASYALGASFARRPGLKFANGEWLDLDVTDPLFLVTASNRWPGIFQSFRGTLDHKGNATATVNIPPGLPKLGDMAIFVAGVIYKGQHMIQVTNTHWFVLP